MFGFADDRRRSDILRLWEHPKPTARGRLKLDCDQ
jgi:hypothetical protein